MAGQIRQMMTNEPDHQIELATALGQGVGIGVNYRSVFGAAAESCITERSKRGPGQRSPYLTRDRPIRARLGVTSVGHAILSRTQTKQYVCAK
jgi:hypothetical protein